jgi:hypothetical protein
MVSTSPQRQQGGEKAEAATMTIEFTCAGCGRRLRVNDSRSGSLMRCSKCQAVCTVPAVAPAVADDRDADSCPKCGKPMAAKAVLCIECGFNRNTGQQFKTKSKRRAYHLGNSPYTSLRFLIAGGCLLAAIGIIVLARVGMHDDQSPWIVVGIELLPLGGLVLAGTSSRYTVTRDVKGTPRLRERSWFCFFAVRGSNYNLNDYDGLFLDYVPPVGKRPERYMLQLRWKKDHEVFDTIYEGADQGMMGELVDGIKEFTDLHLERR